MVEANISITMAATTLVIGSKGKWKEKDNWSMQMATSFMRDSGEMITMKVKANCQAEVQIG